MTSSARVGVLTLRERGGFTLGLRTMPGAGASRRFPLTAQRQSTTADEVMPKVPHYEFIVRGQPDVDAHALESATGLRCTPLDRTAKLDGELVDRAALHGVIEGLYRLGLDLLAVERRTSRHAT